MYNRPLVPHPATIIEGQQNNDSEFSLQDISHTPGQAAAIRFFDPDSSADLESMRAILRGKQSKKWMDDTQQLTVSDYRDWAGTENETSFLFAVLDARNPDPENIKKLRGFIFIYSEREEKFRVKRMERLGFIPASDKPRYLLEVSFAVRPLEDGVQSGSGLMSSGLRQSCLQVQMLLQNEQKPEVDLFGFVDPENLAAQRTLEACGFVKKGSMKYDWDSSEETYLYILDWALLQAKVKEKLLAALQQS